MLLLIETLRSAGATWEELSPQSETGRIVCFAARDSRHEVESAARWVRHLLEEGEKSIGVVVPDLQMRRRQIERTFREQIDPAATTVLHDDDTVFSLLPQCSCIRPCLGLESI